MKLQTLKKHSVTIYKTTQHNTLSILHSNLLRPQIHLKEHQLILQPLPLHSHSKISLSFPLKFLFLISCFLNFSDSLNRRWNQKTLIGTTSTPPSFKTTRTSTSTRPNGLISLLPMSFWLMKMTMKPGFALKVRSSSNKG